MKIKRVVLGAGVLTMGCMFAWVPPFHALTSDSIIVPNIAHAGSPVVIQVQSIFDAKKCTVALKGPRSTKASTFPVRGYTLKAKVRTTGLPAGQYRAVATCPGAGRAVSSQFSLVPQSEPLQATCDVVEKGFSLSIENEVNAGFVVRNASSVLSASDIMLSVNFRNAAGNLLLSSRTSTPDIPPGQSVIAGIDGWSDGQPIPTATTMEVVSTCEDAYSPAPSLIRGRASIVPTPIEGGIGLQATITNETSSPLADNASISYLIRNQAGAIVGGNWNYLRADVPIGSQTLWDTFSSVQPANAAGVEYIVSADSPF